MIYTFALSMGCLVFFSIIKMSEYEEISLICFFNKRMYERRQEMEENRHYITRGLLRGEQIILWFTTCDLFSKWSIFHLWQELIYLINLDLPLSLQLEPYTEFTNFFTILFTLRSRVIRCIRSQDPFLRDLSFIFYFFYFFVGTAWVPS